MKEWYAIGVMSGTSLDGVDIAYVKFSLINDTYSYHIITTETITYSPEWQNKLRNAFHGTAREIIELDSRYGVLLGNLIKTFITKNRILKLDFIASHGHTIFHQPDKGYTLQIGNGATIASIVKKTVISDFRTQDVALGGQGAPLVPIGDKLLFSEYDTCINIGGFANISYDDANGIRIAFDICPANILLNHYANKINLEYDQDGKLAAKGIVNKHLLDSLNNLDIYQFRKSMSYETIITHFIPLIDSYQLNIENTFSTITEHIALQITRSINNHNKSLLTGGGTYNSFLIKRIQKHSNTPFIIPDKQLIEFKESLIFAFLGLLRIEEKINVLSSVTQAKKDHSSGIIYDFY